MRRMMAGVGMLFVPLNNAAYHYLPKDQMNNATGMFNMLRNEGGSLGVIARPRPCSTGGRNSTSRGWPSTSTASTRSRRTGSAAWRSGCTGAGPTRSWPAARACGCSRERSSSRPAAMAYFDLFWLYAILALTMIPLVLLMRRSVAEGGTMAVH